MHGMLLACALLLMLVLTAPALATESSSDAPPNGPPVQAIVTAGFDQTQKTYASSTTIGSSGKVLIVQDQDPWALSANREALDMLRAPYDVIGSAQLATASLTPYRAVLLPSAQPEEYYQALQANVAKIERYVYQGGKLLAHMATYSSVPWAGMHILPANVQMVWEAQNDLAVTAPSDPVASGKPRGFTALDNTMMDGIGHSSHGYLTALPFNAVRVISAGKRR
jgi:hypothetical protein